MLAVAASSVGFLFKSVTFGENGTRAKRLLLFSSISPPVCGNIVKFSPCGEYKRFVFGFAHST